MRRLLTPLLAAIALNVAAQDRPPRLEPLPEPPPPPPGVAVDDLGPQVTITRRGEDKVEEYRVNGKLYMIKVTPARGVPYYLVDREGDGKFTRDDTFTGNNIRPPMWVIFSW